MRNDRLREIAASVLRVAPSTLGPDSALGSIETWDSLAHVELVFRLEEEFGLRFPMHRIIEMRTLSDFETEIDRLRAEIA